MSDNIFVENLLLRSRLRESYKKIIGLCRNWLDTKYKKPEDVLDVQLDEWRYDSKKDVVVLRCHFAHSYSGYWDEIRVPVNEILNTN